MAFVVAQRKKELGIRLALGAQPGFVIWLVMREVLILLAIAALGSVAMVCITALLWNGADRGLLLLGAVAALVLVLSSAHLLPQLRNPFAESTTVRSQPALLKSITALR